MKHRICILLAVLLLWPVSLLAATRAWLEQPQVTLGQAVTLNVETDAVSATPDLTPLMRDFEVEGQSDSRSVRMVNGRMSASTTSLEALGDADVAAALLQRRVELARLVLDRAVVDGDADPIGVLGGEDARDPARLLVVVPDGDDHLQVRVILAQQAIEGRAHHLLALVPTRHEE